MSFLQERSPTELSLERSAHASPRAHGRRPSRRSASRCVERAIRDRLRGIDAEFLHGERHVGDRHGEGRAGEFAAPDLSTPDVSTPHTSCHESVQPSAQLCIGHASIVAGDQGAASAWPVFLQGGALHSIEGIPLVSGDWLVPFACIEHVLQSMAADPEPSWSQLVSRGVVWIGDRVRPAWSDADPCVAVDPCVAADPCVAVAASVMRASVFVRDRSRVPGESAARSCMLHRVWTAEQAMRMNAAGVVILDGTALDMLAWRRLQLSVLQPVLESDPPAGVDRPNAPAARPVMLVICPPAAGADASRHVVRRGCTAATRWSVHADMHDGARDDAGAWRSERHHLDFVWRMRLDFARGNHPGVPIEATGSIGAHRVVPDAIYRSALESGLLQVVVRRSRALQAHVGWRACRTDRGPVQGEAAWAAPEACVISLDVVERGVLRPERAA